MNRQQRTLFEQKNLTCGELNATYGSSASPRLSIDRRSTFTSVQYDKLSQIQERDMFQRVQLGMPLKEGEKLQAQFGEWPSFCSDLCKRYVENEGGLHDALGWDTGRGVGFQTIATVVRHR